MKHASIPFKTVEDFVPYVSKEIIDLVFLVTGILSPFVLFFHDNLKTHVPEVRTHAHRACSPSRWCGTVTLVPSGRDGKRSHHCVHNEV